jgi:hypothetical protein
MKKLGPKVQSHQDNRGLLLSKVGTSLSLHGLRYAMQVQSAACPQQWSHLAPAKVYTKSPSQRRSRNPATGKISIPSSVVRGIVSSEMTIFLLTFGK